MRYKRRHLLRVHANPIVPHPQQNIRPIPANLHFDFSFLHKQIQPVGDCVFNQGLQRNFVAKIVRAALIHMERIGKAVFISVLLDLKITFCMFKLFGYRNQFMPLADADSEQPRKGMHHLHGICIAATLTHPGD